MNALPLFLSLFLLLSCEELPLPDFFFSEPSGSVQSTIGCSTSSQSDRYPSLLSPLTGMNCVGSFPIKSDFLLKNITHEFCSTVGGVTCSFGVFSETVEDEEIKKVYSSSIFNLPTCGAEIEKQNVGISEIRKIHPSNCSSSKFYICSMCSDVVRANLIAKCSAKKVSSAGLGFGNVFGDTLYRLYGTNDTNIPLFSFSIVVDRTREFEYFILVTAVVVLIILGVIVVCVCVYVFGCVVERCQYYNFSTYDPWKHEDLEIDTTRGEEILPRENPSDIMFPGEEDV